MNNQQKFSEKRRQFLGSIAATIVLPGCGGGQDAGATAGKPTVISAQQSSNPISLQELSKKTMYVAHRGGAAVYPENTFVAFDSILAFGELMLETDVQTLANNSLGLMHDTEVARTTTSQGKVSDLSDIQWQQLSIDSNTWHGSNFPNNAPPPFFSEWIDRYKGRAILIPEDKDLKSTSAMITALNAAQVDKNQVLFQSFTLANLTTAVQAGYSACLLHYGGQDPSVALSVGVRWAGIDYAATDANIQRWVNSGVKVLVWTVNRRYIRDAKLKLGVAGFISDDPIYLRNHAPLRTSDNFALQTWMPGMLSSVSDFALPSRGKFFAGSYWGYDTLALNYLGCLQGYLCPIKGLSNPTSYQVEFKIKFEGALGSDQARWASVFIGTDDQPFTDSVSDQATGYHFLFLKNGAIQMYKKLPGTSGILLASVNGSLIEDGDEVLYQITITETHVITARLSSERKELYSLTCNDTSVRGSYLHLGRNGLACKFRQISIT